MWRCDGSAETSRFGSSICSSKDKVISSKQMGHEEDTRTNKKQKKLITIQVDCDRETILSFLGFGCVRPICVRGELLVTHMSHTSTHKTNYDNDNVIRCESLQGRTLLPNRHACVWVISSAHVLVLPYYHH